MSDEFSAKVSRWVAQTKERQEAVFKESSKRVFHAAQVGMGDAPGIPVDTGFARASARASTQAMPPIEPGSRGARGQQHGDQDAAVVATIASAKLGDTIYFGWTASYVGELERGHSQQAPQGFVRLAVLQWPVVVKQAAADLKRRASA